MNEVNAFATKYIQFWKSNSTCISDKTCFIISKELDNEENNQFLAIEYNNLYFLDIALLFAILIGR